MPPGARLPRRKRHLLLTAALAVLFVLLTAASVWLLRPGDATYRPGEEVEGLTATLDRSLPERPPAARFTDVTVEAGIDFRHFAGTRTSQLPEDMGSGAAWGDYDRDGWPDLYVVNFAGPLDDPLPSAAAGVRAHLYRNLGDGTFEEVAESAGVDFRGRGMAAAWGDYDDDGWPDLVVTAYGENVLYRNLGDGTFEDVTRRAGLAGEVAFWTGAAWADYDRDGYPDLYVTGYVRYSPHTGRPPALQYEVEVPASLNPSAFRPERNLLYRNRGGGTFEEVAEAAGVRGDEGRSLAAAWADFDDDGWPDLYVANDVSDNLLYWNRGDGTFEDASHAARVADYRGAMGLAVGDWDGDSDLDLFVTHWIAQENALYVNRLSALRRLDPPPARLLQFADEADRHGLGQTALDYIGWGTSFLDYDNDGRLDLFVVNGSTFQRPERPELLDPMRDQLFWNAGPERGFYDVSSVAGPWFGVARVGRGAAFADYDRDGDVDAFVTNHGDRAALLRNDGGNAAGWVEVRLEGRESIRSALGARLRLVAAGRVQVREVGAQASYLSQNDLTQHFGLGAVERVDTLVIRWPAGGKQTLTDLPIRRVLRVVEGEEGFLMEAPARARRRVAAGRVGSADGTASGQPAAPVGEAAGRRDGTASGRDRERVVRFWEAYRQATRDRIGGRAERAAQGYARALELDPAHEDALYYLGHARLTSGRPEEARDAWRRLVLANPRSARGHMQLGIVHACLDAPDLLDLERAEAAFRTAREINAEETGASLRLAEVALLRGRVAAARKHLEAVLGTHAGSVAARYLLGYVEWKAGDVGKAADHFGAALRARAPDPAPGGTSGEGDTRRGGSPLLAERRMCRGIVDAVPERLAGELPPSGEGAEALRRRAVRSYRELDRRLERSPPDGS